MPQARGRQHCPIYLTRPLNTEHFYLIRYSDSGSDDTKPSQMLKNSSHSLRIGDRAPDFVLPAAKREIVRLSDYRGQPVVIVFIRGTW
jgi:hypothetical protein